MKRWLSTQRKNLFFFTQISIECWCHDVVYGRIERRGWSISASDLSHMLGLRRFSRSNTEKYDKIIFKFYLLPPGFHLVFIRIGSGNFPIWAVDAKMVLVMFPKLEIHNFELNFGSIRDGKGLFHSIVFGILLWVIRRLELTLSSSLYQTHWWNFFPCSKKTLPVLHVVAFKPNMQLVVPACEWSWKIFPTNDLVNCAGWFILLSKFNNSWQNDIICSAVRRLLQIKDLKLNLYMRVSVGLKVIFHAGLVRVVQWERWRRNGTASDAWTPEDRQTSLFEWDLLR